MINSINLKLSKIWLSRPQEKLTFFTAFFGLIGIIIGVTTLIVVISIMNGFRYELEKNIKGLTSDISITHNYKNYIIESKNISNLIEENDISNKIVEIIQGQGLVSSNYNSFGTIFKGMKLKDIPHKVKKSIISGDIKNINLNNNIIIGHELANKLNVKVGDNIKIIVPNIYNTLIGAIPLMKEMNIIAIYKTKLYDYDSTITIIDYKTASKLLKTETLPNILEVTLKENQDLDKAVRKISKELKKLNLTPHTWKDQNDQLINALQIERVVMFCILSLIIIVAMFNIILSQFMVVKDRKQDIAILRSFGTKKSDILISFILHSTYIGLLGVTIGTLLGYIIANNIENIKKYAEYFIGYELFDPAIYMLSFLPSKIIVSDIILIVSMTLLICLIGSIYPAYKASNISIIKSIKHE